MLLQISKHNCVIDNGNEFIIHSENLYSYLRYRITDEVLDLFSAYVPESLRGNGHASSLILFALQYAVMNGLRVKANCAAVKAYIKIHPEWSYITI